MLTSAGFTYADENNSAGIFTIESANTHTAGILLAAVGFDTRVIGPFHLSGNVGVDIPSIIEAGLAANSPTTTPPVPATPYHVLGATYSSAALYSSLRLIDSSRFTLDAFYGGQLLNLLESDCLEKTTPVDPAQETCSYKGHTENGRVAGLSAGFRLDSAAMLTAGIGRFANSPTDPGNFISLGIRMLY
jgi:hypothetical protein